MLVQIKDISKIMRQIIMQRVSPKLLYQLYKSVCVAKQVYEFVILKEELTEYLQDKIPTFVSLMDKATAIIDYFNETLIMEDCKDIDNITKIEQSFIKNGVDDDLDNQIKTLMDSEDQLEACRSYFSSLISLDVFISFNI